MSTYWYFQCLDHDPVIESRDEFTQHTDDAAYKNALDLARNRPLEPPDGQDYFEANARRFLSDHPYCALGLINEYRHMATVEETLRVEKRLVIPGAERGGSGE